MNTQSMLDRQQMALQSQDAIKAVMIKSGIVHPVGMILDVRDFHARQMALATGNTDDEIDSLITRHKGKAIPTLLTAVSRKDAAYLLPHTSSSAAETFASVCTLADVLRAEVIVVMAGKGNLYSVLRIGDEAKV